MIYDIIERWVGYKERKLGAVILIGLAGGVILSPSTFNWMQKGLTAFPAINFINGLGVLLIIIAIGWWRNRIG